MSNSILFAFGGSGQDVTEFNFVLESMGAIPPDAWLVQAYEAFALLVPSLPGFHGPLRRGGISLTYDESRTVDIPNPS